MNPFLFRLFRGAETSFHELNYLFWECTTRCNLSCRHCGSDCGVQSRQKDMPLEDFLRVLDTIPSKDRPKNFTVVLTGGEPTLRPDLVRCGEEITRRGFAWGMVSNGYFYSEDKQAQLLRAGMRTLTISLDGLEASHDWMRGREGSFARASEAIRLAASVKGLAFDVVTCVNKRNLTELPNIHNLLESWGVPGWRLFTIIPIGRAANDPDMVLSDDEFKQMMEFIKSCREGRCPVGAIEDADKTVGPLNKAGGESSRMKTTFSCEGYLGKYENVVRDTPFFCHAGINIASVLIDGRICACPNIDRDAFAQGSIYCDNFYEVWQNRFEPFRKRDPGGICGGCEKWRDCLGGGMHNIKGDSLAPLECLYRKTL